MPNFEYKKSHLWFKNKATNGILKGGEFTIVNSAIPDGEDPDGLNPGSTKKFDDASKTYFTFKVGHRAENHIGKYWNSNIPADGCTQNKPADELWFAFGGFLKLTFEINGEAVEMSYPDIWLAQGPDGDWWFGSKSCRYTDCEIDIDGTKHKYDQCVLTEGMDNKGGIFHTTFAKGDDKKSNEIHIVKLKVSGGN